LKWRGRRTRGLNFNFNAFADGGRLIREIRDIRG
jgi:hypothetical protein